jgi:hypothetical protein
LPVGYPQDGDPEPALAYLGVPTWTALHPKPFIPWGKAKLGAGNTEYAVCLTVERELLAPDEGPAPDLVVLKKGDTPETANLVPLIQFTVDLPAMRQWSAQPAESAIRKHVKDFDDYVFVIGE